MSSNSLVFQVSEERCESQKIPSSGLRVLMVPSEYPVSPESFQGIFVKEQAIALQQIGVTVNVINVEARRLHTFRLGLLKESHFQRWIQEEGGLLEIRRRGWNPILNRVTGGRIWSFLTQQLAEQYIRDYGLPDIIHAHNALWAGYACRDLSKKYGIPVVLTEHSSIYAEGRVTKAAKYARASYRGASSVVCVSRSVAGHIETYSDKPATVIPNLVNTDFFTLPAEEPVASPFIFLAIGGMDPVKKFDVLLRAFASYPGRAADVRLRIGGGGREMQSLQALAAQLGIQGRVEFIGRLSRDQVRKEMWEAHSLVVSSQFETFGLVVIEALATGLPVVSTRCGGPEDILTPEVGLLVEQGSVEQLAAAMHEITLRPRADRKILRQMAVSKFGALAVAERLYLHYQSLLKSKRVIC